jgi:hypoxanthine phosphoribosyltransferase
MNSSSVGALKLSPYLSSEKIQKRIQEMATELNKKWGQQKVVAVCVLKGSFMFYSDLIRQLDFDVRCDFFGASSYQGSTSSSGEVKITLDLIGPIEGQNVLLIEDIVDTGLTMNAMRTIFESRKPKSISTVALLEKPEALKVPCKIDHVGFKIPNDFVVGYGLDYQGLYRNLPYIAQVQDLQ